MLTARNPRATLDTVAALLGAHWHLDCLHIGRTRVAWVNGSGVVLAPVYRGLDIAMAARNVGGFASPEQVAAEIRQRWPELCVGQKAA